MAHQLACVYIRNADNILLLEIILYRFVSLLAAVGDVIVFTNQPCYLDVPRFNFIFIYSIVTDMRISRHHDLPEIGGIGKYLLVAGHAGIEADLAGGSSHFSGGLSIKNCSVSQQ